MYCCLTLPYNPGYPGSVYCGDINRHLLYVRQYANEESKSVDGLACGAHKDAKQAQATCKAISGLREAISLAWAPYPGSYWQYGQYYYEITQ